MIVGAACLSHSPLKDRNRAAPGVEARFDAAVSRAAQIVAGLAPDLTIVFYPDHLNGFFYKLLPSFCIGIEGASVGDYGTSAGRLDIPADQAADLARAVLADGVDAAISYDMQVDHGAAQPLEWLSEERPLFRAIPIFVNAAAAPLPSFARVRALGEAVGRWARAIPERVLLIGSGGLSHDPPVPALAGAAAEVRQRLVAGHPLDHGQRFGRQSRAHGEGQAMASGMSRLLPANPEWDRAMMDAFLAGRLSVLDAVPDAELTKVAGRGGHEVRSWIAALAALGPGYRANELFCEVIPEWITGMGIMTATPA